MAPQSHQFLSSLTIIFSVLLLYPSVALAIPPELTRELCNKREMSWAPDFCTKTLAQPSIVASKEINQVQAAVMKLASSDANKTLDFISFELAKKSPAIPPKVIQSLVKVCKIQYRHAVNVFSRMPEIVKRPNVTFSSWRLGFCREEDSCSTYMRTWKLNIPELTERNKSLMRFCTLGAVVTDKLQNIVYEGR